eukprot:scaffold14715_cov112-Isochrysis_galbana.AAC.2
MAGGGIHPEECMPPNVRCFGRQASAKSEVGSAHPKMGPEYGRRQRASAVPRTPVGAAQKPKARHCSPH